MTVKLQPIDLHHVYMVVMLGVLFASARKGDGVVAALAATNHNSYHGTCSMPPSDATHSTARTCPELPKVLKQGRYPKP